MTNKTKLMQVASAALVFAAVLFGSTAASAQSANLDDLQKQLDDARKKQQQQEQQKRSEDAARKARQEQKDREAEAARKTQQEQREREEEAARKAREEAAAMLRPGRIFQDCADCPEMVVVGPGSFQMGSPPGERDREKDEGPQRSVSIGQPFALGRTEVTVGQWRRFVSATNYVTDAEKGVGGKSGCNTWSSDDGKYDWRGAHTWREPGRNQRDDEPAVCVSLRDARAYVEWMTRITGKTYRVPTEAEWEFAARAGSGTSRPWGDDPNQACSYANVADQTRGPKGHGWDTGHRCNDGFFSTAPVKSYRANAFGLHDMIGNVSEWVQDCYVEDAYGGKAPSDGSAYQLAGCSDRVARGASWANDPRTARSATRDSGLGAANRSDRLGLRIARMLP